MCLITRQTEPFIAEQDITVYKGVQANRFSIVYFNKDVKYTDGATIKAEIKESLGDSDRDILAADSTASMHYKTGLYTFRGGNQTHGLKAYGAGIHVYMNLARASWACSTVLKCIIPAGTAYYIDETGLGITEKLVVIGEIK